MNREDMLISLIQQGAANGSDLATLRAIVEEASELGADRVLDRLGLADDKAHADLDELRELLRAWRDAKASARRAVIEWLARTVLALLLLGIVVRFGLTDLLK